jgi:tetratricopeptide (TPR) repeat protein
MCLTLLVIGHQKSRRLPSLSSAPSTWRYHMIKPLDLHDQRHLEAAEGWIELGNHLEANEELEQITPELRGHPDVLEIRWQIYAKAKKWDAALDLASALIQLVPELPLGWVHRSYCLHELKRSEEARDNLLRVVDKFPEDPIMRYNLAWYECQLGRLEQARNWLEKAFDLGHSRKIKWMALEDPDLEPLWRKIGET